MRKPMIRILLSLLLVVVVAVGGTFAYLMATDSPLLNTFTLAEVETEIVETGSTSADKSAVVKNTGKSPVYVRARVVVSGVDPTLLDVKYNTNPQNGETGWQYDEADGFYYYMAILPANPSTQPSTSALFTGVNVKPDVGPDATFSVDVYQESVLAPADGTTWTLDDAKTAFNAKG